MIISNHMQIQLYITRFEMTLVATRKSMPVSH